MYRRFFSFFILLMCLVPAALGENVLYPKLTDPVDQYMQSFAIMFQRDEPFVDVDYNNSTLKERGCQPVSIANGLIAAFGVTDRDAAVQIVLETADLLVPRGKKERAPVLPELIPDMLDPEKMALATDYPVISNLICSYPGALSATFDLLDAEEAISLLSAHSAPAIVSFRMSVERSWENVVRVLFALHDIGMDDATVCLARASVGKGKYGTPFASGKNGHFISAFVHVGKFMEDGSIYLLDSLPRAIPGEISSDENIYHARYPFGEQRETNHFNQTYAPTRIQPCVIRLSLRDAARAALTGETAEEQVWLRTDYLKSFTLYGVETMLINLPGKTAAGQ